MNYHTKDKVAKTFRAVEVRDLVEDVKARMLKDIHRDDHEFKGVLDVSNYQHAIVTMADNIIIELIKRS